MGVYTGYTDLVDVYSINYCVEGRVEIIQQVDDLNAKHIVHVCFIQIRYNTLLFRT